MDTLQVIEPGRRQRRRHSDEFKADVIAACRSGRSIAAVALANGLNANLLRKWVVEAERGGGAPELPPSPAPQAAFIALPLPTAAEPAAAPAPLLEPLAGVFLEIHRGDTSVYVTLPAGTNSAAWLREVLA